MRRVPSDEILSAAQMADHLRAWLLTQAADPQVQVAALLYAAGALIAMSAITEPDAFTLIDTWATVMKEQIQALGVGVEHP